MNILLYSIFLVLSRFQLYSDLLLLIMTLIIILIVILSSSKFPIKTITLIILGLIIGRIGLTIHKYQFNFEPIYNVSCALEGMVLESPRTKAGRTEMEIKINKINGSQIQSDRVFYVRVENIHNSQIRFGDRLILTGKLQPLTPMQYDPFSIQCSNDTQRAIVVSAHLVRVIPSEKLIYFPKRVAIIIREHVVNILNKELPVPFNFLVEGLLIGNHQNGIPKEMNDLFKKTGIIHILVVSGSQIALLTQMMLLTLELFTDRPLVKFIIINGVNFIFVLLSGGDPSVIRAAMMMGITQGAIVFKRKSNPTRTMAIVGAGMLSINPGYLLNYGFILSFLATWSLISLAPIIEKMLNFIKSEKLRTMLSIGIAPYLMTTPFIVLINATVSIVSVPVNIIILPIIELIVYFGTATLVIYNICTPLAHFGWPLIKVCIQFVINIVNFAGNLPLSSMPISVHWSLLLFCYGLIFTIFYQSIRRYSLGVMAIALMITLIPSSHAHLLATQGFTANQVLDITMINVGNGLAILLITPDGKSILLDAGSDRVALAQNSLINTLKQKGLQHIDYLFISHAHTDHFDLVEQLDQIFPIKHLFITRFLGTDPAYHALLRQHQGHYSTIGRGTNFEWEKLRIKILTPALHSKNLTLPDDQLNDKSISALIQYGSYHLLFTGDLCGSASELLLQEPLPHIDTLQVPHHGGKNLYFGALVEKVRPTEALISVGENNHYHHPAASTLSVLQKYGVRILRTDSNGSIEIQTDGNKVIEYYKKL